MGFFSPPFLLLLCTSAQGFWAQRACSSAPQGDLHYYSYYSSLWYCATWLVSRAVLQEVRAGWQNTKLCSGLVLKVKEVCAGEHVSDLLHEPLSFLLCCLIFILTWNWRESIFVVGFFFALSAVVLVLHSLVGVEPRKKKSLSVRFLHMLTHWCCTHTPFFIPKTQLI